MRILVLCYEFPPVGGGGGRVAEDLCRYFTMHGHEVLVHTSGFKNITHDEERFGFSIKRTFSFRKKQDKCTIPEMFFYVLTNLFPSLYYAISWKPQIIHCHFAVPTGIIACIISFITKVPYVLTAHLGDVPGGVPEQTDKVFKYIKPFTSFIWKGAAAITAVSEHVANLAHNAYGISAQIIANGIEILPKQLSNFRPHQPVKLIFAGRFNAQKNLLFLIDVLTQLTEFEWTMDFVGEGDLMPQVRDAVAVNNLEKRVCFHGWLSPDKADIIMSDCDILILPSKYEGMPVVGVKALLYGLAIIASDIDGMKGIVSHNVNGYLCPVNDMNAFVNSLKTLITDTELLCLMKEKSYALAENFDLSIISASYESVFEKVVE